MKKGIERWSDYDERGRWCLRLKKQKGHFTLNEITEALTEYEWDFYAIVLKCIPADGLQYFDDVEDPGDYITAYRATDFLKAEEGER